MTRLRRPGALHGVYLGWGVLAVIAQACAAAFHEPLLVLTRVEPAVAHTLGIGAVLGLGLLGVLAILSLLRLRQLPRDAPGRMRLAIGAGAGLIDALAFGALWGLAARVDLGPSAAFGFSLVLPKAIAPWVYLAGGVALASGLVLLGSAVAAWFLLREPLRQRIWVAFDVLILGATAYALTALPARPPLDDPDALTLPVLRHAVTTLAVLRLTARLVPVAFDLVERLGFRPLVAARHLRAKKSGFLAAISILSVLAVTVSCAALTTTLSVMGGFRQDLKGKILGNNAHVVIDQAHGSFEGWAPVVSQAAQAPGVTGAAPFVSGEVMLSSASNLATGLLRGIDPERVGGVIDLPDNLTSGSMRYLTEPETLRDLPPDAMRQGMSAQDILEEVRSLREGLDEATRAPDELLPGTAPPGPGPVEEEGAQARPVPAPSAGDDGLQARPAPDAGGAGARPVLPGIIIGQELARTLRLYVGDEVNVVAPLGALGPAGPMPKSRPFRVAGIFYSGMYEYDMKYAYVTLETAQRFLNTGDAISGIEIKVDDTDAAPEVAAHVRERIDRDGLRVRDWQTLNSRLFGALELEKLAMFIALGIAILVASFCIAGTLTLMVQEKGREVAVLKAMGTPDSKVVGVFVVEGGLVGFFGAALGLFLGYMVCFAAESFGIRMNPEVYYIDRLPVHIDAMEFALVGIAAVVVCLLVTIYPALLASRLRPVDALRHE